MIFVLLGLVTAEAALLEGKFALTPTGQKQFKYSWDSRLSEGSVAFVAKGVGVATAGTYPAISLKPDELIGCSLKGQAVLTRLNPKTWSVKIDLKIDGFTCDYSVLSFLHESPIEVDLGAQKLRVGDTPFNVCADIDSCERKNGALSFLDRGYGLWRLARYQRGQQYWRDPDTGLAWGAPEAAFQLDQQGALKFCVGQKKRLPTLREVPGALMITDIFRLIGAKDIYWTSTSPEPGYGVGYGARSTHMTNQSVKYGALCVYDAF